MNISESEGVWLVEPNHGLIGQLRLDTSFMEGRIERRIKKAASDND